MRCERARTEVRQIAGRRCHNRCHTCAGTVSSAKPLPLELRHPGQVKTMLFDFCRALTDLASDGVVPMDLSMLGKGKGKAKATGNRQAQAQAGRHRHRHRQRQRAKGTAKTTKYFDGYCLQCKAWGRMKKDGRWTERHLWKLQPFQLQALRVSHGSLECCYTRMMQKLPCLTLHSGCIR